MAVQGLFFLDWLKGLFSTEDGQQKNEVVQEVVQKEKETCIEVSGAPWAAHYDMAGDGYIDSDDLAALIYSSSKAKLGFEKDCLGVKLDMLSHEVAWKLRTEIARLPQRGLSPEQTTRALENIDTIERDALAVYDILSQDNPFTTVKQEVWASVIELCLRARGIVQGVTEEPFGAGLDLVPVPGRSHVTGYQVTAIHPESAAVRDGLRVGDVIVAIDSKTMSDLVANGTPEEFIDPNTQMLRGMGGERGSIVTLRVTRNRESVELSVHRNIWSARTLTVQHDAPVWDGTVMYQAEP